MKIHESIDVILQQQELVTHLFYEKFLGRYPSIARHFEGIDLKRQAVQLNMTLLLIAHHYQHGYPATRMYLTQLGQQHQTRKRVPREAYSQFRECLLETLQFFHKTDWSESLALEWSHAIDLATETMISGYTDSDSEPDSDAPAHSPLPMSRTDASK